MKRIAFVLLVLAVIFSLAGCSTREIGNSGDVSSGGRKNAKINLNDYVEIPANGLYAYGGVYFNGNGILCFNKERFLVDHIDDISFNKKTGQVYKELYNYSEKSAAYEILSFIKCNIKYDYGDYHGENNPNYDSGLYRYYYLIPNFDSTLYNYFDTSRWKTAEITWDIDTYMIDTYFDLDFTYSPFTITNDAQQ